MRGDDIVDGLMGYVGLRDLGLLIRSYLPTWFLMVGSRTGDVEVWEVFSKDHVRTIQLERFLIKKDAQLRHMRCIDRANQTWVLVTRHGWHNGTGIGDQNHGTTSQVWVGPLDGLSTRDIFSLSTEERFPLSTRDRFSLSTEDKISLSTELLTEDRFRAEWPEERAGFVFPPLCNHELQAMTSVQMRLEDCHYPLCSRYHRNVCWNYPDLTTVTSWTNKPGWQSASAERKPADFHALLRYFMTPPSLGIPEFASSKEAQGWLDKHPGWEKQLQNVIRVSQGCSLWIYTNEVVLCDHINQKHHKLEISIDPHIVLLLPERNPRFVAAIRLFYPKAPYTPHKISPVVLEMWPTFQRIISGCKSINYVKDTSYELLHIPPCPMQQSCSFVFARCQERMHDQDEIQQLQITVYNIAAGKCSAQFESQIPANRHNLPIYAILS